MVCSRSGHLPLLCGCATRLHSAALCPLCLPCTHSELSGDFNFCLSAALSGWLGTLFHCLTPFVSNCTRSALPLQLSSAVLAHSGVAVQHPQPLTVSRHYIATHVPQLNRLRLCLLERAWLLRPASVHVSHQCQSHSFSASNSPLLRQTPSGRARLLQR